MTISSTQARNLSIYLPVNLIQILSRFQRSLYTLFRTVIPAIEDRTRISLDVAPRILVAFLPFIYMAYLARREGTYRLRLILLPITILPPLWASFGHYWTMPTMNVINWGQCLYALVVVSKALEYALTPEGMLMVDEIRPGVTKGKAVPRTRGTVNGYARTSPKDRPVAWIADPMMLVHTMRGQRFKFGQGLHIPADSRSLDRDAFIKSNIYTFVKSFVLLDCLEVVLKLFPGVGNVNGGPMFYQDLPVFQRYTVSTIIHLITGSALLAGFEMGYSIATLCAVGIFHDEPSFWPPIQDQPFLSESMHELWSKRWHQLLRRVFYVYGGYPGRKIAGDVGLVFGMFIGSGLFHEVSMYGMGYGWDWAPVIFFASQGPILVLERLWRTLTGRRVGGKWGRLWVYFIMFVCAQPMINSWHRRGLGGGLVIPPFLSPLRLFLRTALRFQ